MTQSARGQWICRVSENVSLCREHFRLGLKLASFPPTEAGQFIQIACRPVIECSDAADDALADASAMLRRPFSLAGRRDGADGVELSIIHRVVGVGTEWLSRLKVGDAVNILGPLGNRFAMPPADSMAILVGGGVGIPPMLYLAGQLGGRQAVAFAGAMSNDLLPLDVRQAGGDALAPSMCIGEFARHGIASIISTDDGSAGFRGFVTEALERYLDHTPPAKRATIYACGPEGMLKRIADIAKARGLQSQIAVERAMACGMGTCQSCCIKVKKPDAARPPLAGSDWCYRLACTDGPVFAGDVLLW